MERKDHRFVLHVWREPSASPPRWRGSVYEVATTLSIVSDKLRDLWDFIALRLDASHSEPRSKGGVSKDEA